MRVWLLQTGEPMPFDRDGSRPMRAVNLTRSLQEAGHEVLVWTADFDHRTHSHRYGRNTEVRSRHLTVRYLHSRGYVNNVGLARLIDHAELARQLRRALSDPQTQKPDVAFIGYPPIEPASVMVKWLVDRQVPCLLDVKDAWPDVLLRAIPESLDVLGHAILSPYYSSMRRTFGRATALSAMAEPFLEWALGQAGRSRNELDASFPLTSRTTHFSHAQYSDAERWCEQQGYGQDGRFTLGFVGTLHSSYVWEPVLEAAKVHSDARFVIAGDGSQHEELRRRAKHLANVALPGWVSQVQAEVLARHCDAALIPVGKHVDFEMSVPNKVYDAMAAGLPIMSSLAGATRRLIESERLPQSLVHLVERAKTDVDGTREMGRRAQLLFAERFTVDKVYGALARHLELMASACDG